VDTQAPETVPAEPPPLGWSARRLGRLAAQLGVTTYLEVGVARGQTFLNLELPVRTGVDPSFGFDIEAAMNPSTTLVQKRSDDYFRSLDPGETFDLVFLDGLHTFEQTYRDLCNVLAHAHRRTVVLVDDTIPSDPWSALPDLERSMRLRRQAKAPGSPWHGDVFKVVAALHSFHPTLDYRTIVDSGNPQTLVWRGTRRDDRPPPLDWEAIARMSYFDLLDQRELLNEATEDEAIGLCVAALLGPRATEVV
jgi:hypothetical protein